MISIETVKVIYQGDGTTKDFTFPFRVNASSEVKVYLYKDGTLTQSTSFTVTPTAGSYPSTGGTITLTSDGSQAIDSSTEIVIAREVTLTQLSKFIHLNVLSMEDIERALDTLCMEIQQVNDRAKRGVYVDIKNTDGMLLPNPSEGDTFIWKDGKLTNFNFSQYFADAQGKISTLEESATKSKDEAAASATAAKASETNAATSELNAGNSATASANIAAKSQEYMNEAAASQKAAALSETNAAASQKAAALSETNAAASQTAAKTSEINAALSETNAANSASVAEEAAKAASGLDSSTIVFVGNEQTITGAKTFTGIIKVPTAAAGDNTMNAASTAFVNTAIANTVMFSLDSDGYLCVKEI